MNIERLGELLSWIILSECSTVIWLALAYAYPFLNSHFETAPLAWIAYFPAVIVEIYGVYVSTAIVALVSTIVMHESIFSDFNGDVYV